MTNSLLTFTGVGKGCRLAGIDLGMSWPGVGPSDFLGVNKSFESVQVSEVLPEVSLFKLAEASLSVLHESILRPPEAWPFNRDISKNRVEISDF